MKSSIDWIKQALLDYAKTLPPSAQQPVLACADFHVRAVEKDQADLAELRAKFQTLTEQMERVGASAELAG
jgi:alpha-ketoglutarate-dependent taurine dioxygenase